MTRSKTWRRMRKLLANGRQIGHRQVGSVLKLFDNFADEASLRRWIRSLLCRCQERWNKKEKQKPSADDLSRLSTNFPIRRFFLSGQCQFRHHEQQFNVPTMSQHNYTFYLNRKIATILQSPRLMSRPVYTKSCLIKTGVLRDL